MSVEGLFITVLMLLLGLVGVTLPFMRGRQKVGDVRALHVQQTRDALVTSYERVLATIRDLDEDHRLGKINDDDYQQERDYWADYGVKLLQLLEGDMSQFVDSEAAEESITVNADGELDQAVEDAIRNYRMALESAGR
ncbi:MAG: hypothetical protein KC615_14155 [Anaerolineae bacterium]|nr:hypothetical protein [Anaerolineae bacterium]MCA9894127.1 hypothetical protein [Anaerolineae bacterium]MCB9461440.1 hypothetical protein [Anaerolineaceae bacterium]